jgi:hypothetical protein
LHRKNDEDRNPNAIVVDKDEDRRFNKCVEKRAV